MKEKRKRYFQFGAILLLGIAAFGIKMLLNYNEPPIIYQGNTSLQTSEINDEVSTPSVADQNEPESQTKELLESEKQRFPIFISGAVHSPGVYEITGSTYLYETLQEAGDITDQAAKEYIHLVYQITQPLSVYIPTYEEINQYLAGDENTALLLKNGIAQGVLQMGDYQNQENTSANAANENNNKTTEKNTLAVNINQADTQLLLTLPGVGNATADAIIKYRESNGPFSRIEDIMNVPGIKENKFSALKELITV